MKKKLSSEKKSIGEIGLNKKAEKLPAMQTRSFSQAAETGRLENSWKRFPVAVDAHVFQEWITLVARSRHGAENYDHLKKFVQLARENVAGPDGFQLNAQVKNFDKSPDKASSDAIEEAYHEFSRRKNFDVTGMLCRSDAERMLISSWATDGEVICNVCYGSKYKHGIAFQFIDPMRLDPTQYEELSNGNVVRHGIEMDEDNHPVAYHFQKPVERMYSLGSRNTIRIPAENIIHWFLPEKIGQKRGLPPARTALSRMRMVSKFEDATITNAFAGSAAAGVTRSNDADDPKHENLPLHLEPGKIYDIGNRELTTFQTQFPEASIEIFLRTLLRSIGAGLNVSYHNLANDLTSVNFSSIRQGALDERTVWEGLQNSFCKGVVVPMFEKWLEVALLNQMITIYGKPLKIERLKKYQAVEFIGRRWAWIDPAAEQSANERAVAQGFKSRSQVIRETSNRDPEDVWDEIKREKDALQDRGIVPLIPSGSVPPPSNEGNHEVNTV